ncbi:penicillin-binding protein [Psychroflexus maritimus]|uniref:Transpeptidase family protein n=1 Tax=Psychroflexus maritimus TaxID=2714865 RepID=A0A967AC15_9FLAO|nr:penicillin-binding protein [Psychroflexus maritimus]NGZ88838.1 transpeptidase family protein [Psychroflexus maritimus]
MTNNKNILSRFYLLLGLLVVLAGLVGFKLFQIQFLEAEKYKDLAEKTVYRNFTIPPNRGNIYDSEMNLLATSVPKYEIRFDAVTVSEKNFKANLIPLSKALAAMFGESPAHYQHKFKKARATNNRYLFLAKNVDYSDYMKIREFPLFELGAYKGGLIAEQEVMRENPLGKIAERSIGRGNVGFEGAFNHYLKGDKGQRMKQKIAQGQWKPINDINEIEPIDGYDVVTTLDVNIQDIAHHALLEQLEIYEADHGSVVVMETKTGEVKAISNLGRSATSGKYYEKLNYAIYEAHEPGSTFKLMALAAALEDQVVDTSDLVDTKNGKIKYYDRIVRDSRIGGYGEISLAEAFQVSSNTAFAQMVVNNYSNQPEKFVNRLYNMGLNEKIGFSIKGEGTPKIPHPEDANWYGTTLPWLSFGYGVSLTSMQILNFYNAIANDGVAVKPRFVKEIRDKNNLIKDYTQEVESKSICSKKTAQILQKLMEKTVEKGTAKSIYNPNFSMAGKTGTCQTEYWIESGRYISSFVGYFPSANPKYTVSVVIHKPNPQKGYYGSTVAAPVFQKIAHKIYKDTPIQDEVFLTDIEVASSSFLNYFEMAQKYKTIMPNVKGMPVMDAITLLENMGLQVSLTGNGQIVHQQSIPNGNKINQVQPVNLVVH